MNMASECGHFDQDAFRSLRVNAGEETTLKILARFQENIQASTKAIEESVAARNPESLWRACHKIGGSAQLIGFHLQGQHILDISRQVKTDGQASGLESEIEKMILDLKKIEKTLALSCPDLARHLGP